MFYQGEGDLRPTLFHILVFILLLLFQDALFADWAERVSSQAPDSFRFSGEATVAKALVGLRTSAGSFRFCTERKAEIDTWRILSVYPPRPLSFLFASTVRFYTHLAF